MPFAKVMPREPKLPLALALIALLTLTLAAQKTVTVERVRPGVTRMTFQQVAYGSLEFDGSVERVDFGEAWEFRVLLNATFHANTGPNMVPNVRLSTVRVSISPKSGTELRTAAAVARLIERVDVVLTIDGERVSIPPVVFRVLKADLEGAEYVGLGVIGNLRYAWPVSVDLRQLDRP
jgi:hypothetical protein